MRALGKHHQKQHVCIGLIGIKWVGYGTSDASTLFIVLYQLFHHLLKETRLKALQSHSLLMISLMKSIITTSGSVIQYKERLMVAARFTSYILMKSKEVFCQLELMITNQELLQVSS